MTKTWFITGTSSGFGRTLTELLLARGDTVAATLRTPPRLDDLATRYGDQLWVQALDVTDTARLREVVDAAFADLGRIDVVVSNAGSGVLGTAEELSDAHIESSIATNLTASIQLARAVVPHLRAQGGGRIVQLSSMGGHIAYPGFSLYHATKWGIEGFYEAFAPEVEPFGIRTTLVEPGMVRTPFFEAAVREPEHPAYAGNPAITRTDIPLEQMPGDQAKVAAAIIAIGDLEQPPRRQLLGSDAYALVRTALQQRLAAVDTQRAVALTTDVDGFSPTAS
ncbi:SDR family oxidoreductase [Geodermatophilus sp. DSM 44513]|uniref:SDR family oxidoreductase n=1 Tax=Geodermatophilus sp. DSM 44513 TaxID=1528104 RepID=UPI0012801517|nr:SDR family oxidoreductase [Geodermatophilus sp. DSM 44513]WNV75163.1 SDR family oxidoreductase [Geodermatophilus sp. DSM 44513]